jgi:hypothetical protein
MDRERTLEPGDDPRAAQPASDVVAAPGLGYATGMCRNIRILFNFEPPTTVEEMRAAALQYVRKVSGTRAPSQANRPAFERAVDRITAATRELLGGLSTQAAPRTREEEAAKARARGLRRAARS